MKYILAISGGVDSVVLLHKFAKKQKAKDLIVAHFDHGIRPDSQLDAAFVEDLAQKYNLQFVGKRQVLGAAASEETARFYRYKFLREIAKKYNATIVTAHHLNDLAETVAINFIRGTGWRGLAVLNSVDVMRPLLNLSKAEIINYARQHSLAWREDSTNCDTKYLRNRIRPKIKDQDLVLQLAALRARQAEIVAQIDWQIAALNLDSPLERYFFNNIPGSVAREILRSLTKQKLDNQQLERARLAIATFKPHTLLKAGAGVVFVFSTRHFEIQVVK